MQVRVWPYRVALVRPLIINQQRWTHREGYWLGLSDGRHWGWGDAAPLPGFSKESLEAVGDELRSWEAAPSRELCYGSSQWAVDSALTMLKARQNECAMADIWADRQNRKPQSSLEIAQLVMDGGVVHSLSSVVKVKVGRQAWQKDLDDVRYVIERCQPGKLRLDGNRCWTMQETIDFVNALPEGCLEFIEEPCAVVSDLQQLLKLGHVPLALDESLYLDDWDWSADLRGVKALIVKPTLLGGMTRLEPLYELAQQASVDLVISSAFESAVGLGALSQLALAWHHKDVACGLGTYRWLENQGITEFLDLSSDCVSKKSFDDQSLCEWFAAQSRGGRGV